MALRGRVCIVTGVSPNGIGLETAKSLAAQGAHVVLASRNPALAAEARAVIDATDAVKAAAGTTEYMHLDLASLASVSAFAKEFLAKHSSIAVLVNNAGLNTIGRMTATTKDGFALAYGVNFLGHFHLTNLLLPTIFASAPARIVNVSSQMHRVAPVERMNTAATVPHGSGYNCSKLAMVWHTHALQRRCDTAGVDVRCFSVSPGGVRTNIWRTLPGWLQWPFKMLAYVLLLSPAQGSATSVRAALDSTVPAGSYLSPYRFAATFPFPFDFVSLFAGPQVIPSSPASYDPTAEEKLWVTSEKLIKAALKSRE